MANNFRFYSMAVITALLFNYASVLAFSGYPRIKVSSVAGSVYKLPFDEAERQLIDLARKTRVEDVWIYVDTKQALYDIGYDGNSEGTDFTYRTFNEDMTILRNSNAIGIHLHPLVRKDKYVYPPSFNDLWQLASCKYQFKEQYNANFRAIVYDGYGIWQYDMAGDTVALFQEERTREVIRKKLRYLRYIVRFKDNKLQTRAGVISEYISKLRELGIIMEYRDI